MLSKPLFNFDYFGVFKESGLIERGASSVRHTENQNGIVLLIVPCLIGDFVATLPAIVDYMARNKDKKYDLVVTPPLKPLAERIRGVRHVYMARSVAERQGEEYANQTINGEYETVIILRSSLDVLKNITPYIKAHIVVTKTREVALYSIFDLFKNNILRRRPTQWRDFNFTLLGGSVRNVDINEIFDLESSDFERVRTLGLMSSKRNVIIHTGASWIMNYWPIENWVELLTKINADSAYNFIFIGTNKDKPDYDVLAHSLHFPITCALEKLDILDLTILFTLADSFLGIDSGPGNIAHLTGLRSLILYGPGPHTFMSHLEGDMMIDKSNGRGLYQRFFSSNRGFIHSITVDEVYQAFIKLS